MEERKFISMQEKILALLQRDLNVFFSWGACNFRVVPNGLRFAVNGFLYQGDVIVTYDNKRTSEAKEYCFKVQIGDIIATGITASQLANYIDKHVEYSENYDEMVKQAYTPEEIDACKNITGIIFI